MRTRSFAIPALCALWVLLARPMPAAAQCSMMGGGGHDQSTMHGNDTAKPTRSQKKLQQSIDRVLADDEGRVMLMDVLLNDRAFMESFIRRLAMVPEWRSMAAGQFAPMDARDSLGSARPEAPASQTALYTCPMHADVTSSKPGECPRCGMALVRAASIHK